MVQLVEKKRLNLLVVGAQNSGKSLLVQAFTNKGQRVDLEDFGAKFEEVGMHVT